MADAPIPADERSPDRSTCRNCGLPIAWDDWCYVHMNGMADCDVLVTGGTTRPEEVTDDPVALDLMHAAGRVASKIGLVLAWDPTITQVATEKPTRAEPVEWGPRG